MYELHITLQRSENYHSTYCCTCNRMEFFSHRKKTLKNSTRMSRVQQVCQL